MTATASPVGIPDTDSPIVTVYSKPSCVQCTATYRTIDRPGIPYEIVDVSADALNFVKELGYQQAPVVVQDTMQAVVDHWSGSPSGRIRARSGPAGPTPSRVARNCRPHASHGPDHTS